MLIINKEVDYSLLKAGLTIPVLFHNLLFDAIGFNLERGEQRKILIELDGTMYNAVIINIDFDKNKYPTHKDLLQIRYGENSPIAKSLREHFCYSVDLLNQKRNNIIKRQTVKLKSHEKEFLAIYSTERAGVLSLECITNKEYCEENNALRILGEETAEHIFNSHDATADIILKTRVCKIRHLNKTISDDLKKAYGYRCQICGAHIGEKYSSILIHAHHICYFTESLNNNASNIMIVCPNHHYIIHDTNPKFDFDKKVYVYPNGYIEGLSLNYHL